MKIKYLCLFLITITAYVLCYSLINVCSFSSIVSSALIGLLGSFIPRNRFFSYTSGRTLTYSASFCAMTNFELLDKGYLHFLLLPLFIYSTYLLLENRFQGLGGKLGSLSFISVLTFLLIGSALSF